MLSKADTVIKKAKIDFEEDPYRLFFHAMPATGWMNDPNGLIYYKGVIHLFFQFHPFSSENGLKYWGHLTSKNLIDWQYEKTALAPDQEYDASGCYSGSAIVENEKMYLLYTGHTEYNAVKETQCLAVSSDGFQFTKYAKNPVIKPQKDFNWNFRDPKVWKHKNFWYCVVGNCFNGNGRVLLYKSADLLSWDFVSVMLEGNGQQGFMWECPDFFSLAQYDILLLSPEGMNGKRHSTLYMIGKLDYKTGKFTAKQVETIDDGNEFYAPQTFDYQGRRILIGWMDKWFAPMPSQRKGWACAMTVPREITFNKMEFLEMNPVRELEQLYYSQQEFSNIFFEPDSPDFFSQIKLRTGVIKFDIDLSKTDASVFTIIVRENIKTKESTKIIFNMQDKEIILDKTRSGEGEACIQKTPIKYINPLFFDIQILLDTSSIEIFLNKGTTTITNRIYPSKDSTGIKFSVEKNTVYLKKIFVAHIKQNAIGFSEKI